MSSTTRSSGALPVGFGTWGFCEVSVSEPAPLASAVAVEAGVGVAVASLRSDGTPASVFESPPQPATPSASAATRTSARWPAGRRGAWVARRARGGAGGGGGGGGRGAGGAGGGGGGGGVGPGWGAFRGRGGGARRAG